MTLALISLVRPNIYCFFLTKKSKRNKLLFGFLFFGPDFVGSLSVDFKGFSFVGSDFISTFFIGGGGGWGGVGFQFWVSETEILNVKECNPLFLLFGT